MRSQKRELPWQLGSVAMMRLRNHRFRQTRAKSPVFAPALVTITLCLMQSRLCESIVELQGRIRLRVYLGKVYLSQACNEKLCN